MTSSGMRRLMTVIGRSLRSLCLMRSLAVFIGHPFLSRRSTSGDDANRVVFAINVYDKQQNQIFSHSDGRIPMLFFDACVFKADKSVEEDLTRHFKNRCPLRLTYIHCISQVKQLLVQERAAVSARRALHLD